MQDCPSSCPTFHGMNFTIDTKEVEDLDGLFEVSKFSFFIKPSWTSKEQGHLGMWVEHAVRDAASFVTSIVLYQIDCCDTK